MNVKKILGVLCCSLSFGLLFGCGDEAEPVKAQNTVNKTNPGGKGDTTGTNTTTKEDQPLVCVGIRGNGQLIFAHFGVLARIHEHYGMVSGVAGGSSGSISTFFTESIYANKAVYSCESGTCDNATSGERVALMYKSIEGYATEFSMTPEVQSFQALAPILKKAKEEGVGSLIEAEKFEEARQALITVLESDDIRILVNPEVLALLKDSKAPTFHVKDVWDSLSSFGMFSVDSPMALIRPGAISFQGAAELFGRIADFYAGYGPDRSAQWGEFLGACASQSKGKSWSEITELSATGGKTCGDLYSELVTSWRSEALQDPSSYKHRIDEPVGKHISALVATSVITGDAVGIWKGAREKYLSGQLADLDGINFDDVKLAYWGSDADLAQIAKNEQGYSDLKTQKFYALGPKSYREALSLSPAEPGIARALEISDDVVSTGGWSDLEPTLVLKNMGCEQVILVTREGDPVGFGAEVSTQLGMTLAQQEALFEADKESSVKLSLEQADAVWCTDWNNSNPLDIAGTISEAYNAPLEIHSDWFKGAKGGYSNTFQSVDKIGCTPGVGN